MHVDFEFVARLAKIANNNNFVGLLGNSCPPRLIRQRQPFSCLCSFDIKRSPSLNRSRHLPRPRGRLLSSALQSLLWTTKALKKVT
jgi:hypothetical protein